MTRYLCVYWAAVACVTGLCLAGTYSSTLQLTPYTISAYVKEHETVLVNFFDPLSRDSKALASEFEYAADVLAEHDIHLATYDCSVKYDNAQDLCGTMGIRDYPTLLLYRGDTSNPALYKGPKQTAEDMILYMMPNSKPASSSVNTDSPSAGTKDIPIPVSSSSPKSTASNAVWLAEDGSRAVVKLIIPRLFDSKVTSMSKEERLEQRTKSVILIRDSLANRLLHGPSDPNVRAIFEAAALVAQLESHRNLEVCVIRDTNIHKFLRRVMRLSPFPGDAGQTLEQRVVALIKTYEEAVFPPSPTDDRAPQYSVLLDFTISADNKRLLLNSNYHALLVPNPSRPALLQARRVPSNTDLNHLVESDWSAYPLIGLDYSFDARNRGDPGIRYSNHRPRLSLDLIGAGGNSSNASDPVFLLDSLDQKWVQIELAMNNAVYSDERKRKYHIQKIEFVNRNRNFRGRRIEYHVARPDDTSCSWYSWRCADIADPPWYKYVWRDYFDEFGRIGSLRRRLSMWWSRIPWWTKAFAVLAIVMYARGRWARPRRRYIVEVGKQKV